MTRSRGVLCAAFALYGLLAAGTVEPARAEQFINVLTGGTSGVYYPLGVALSTIYAENIPDVRTSVQATKASVENLNLLQSGRGEIAFTLGDSLKLAWEGDADAGFKKKLDKLRGIAGDLPELHPDRGKQGLGHQFARGPQGQAPLGRCAQIGHRAQRTRDPWRGRPVLRRPKQGGVSAVRRIGRTDEEPPARRHAAVGRPRRRLDPRSGQQHRHHRGPGAGRSGRADRLTLCRGDHPRRHLYWPRSGRAGRGRGQLPGHPGRSARRGRLPR